MGLAIIVPSISFDGSLGKVTFKNYVPVSGISIDNGSPAGLNEIQFNAVVTPSYATSPVVNWSIKSGSEYASINSAGLLNVLYGANESTVVIQAECQGITAEKTIEVTYSSSTEYDYYFRREAMGGTYADFEDSGIKLLDDVHTQWSLYASIPVLSVAPGINQIVTLLSLNQNVANPYDGFDLSGYDNNMQPGLKFTASGVKVGVKPLTGEIVTFASSPIFEGDGQTHKVILSRDDAKYTVSINGQDWREIASNFTPTDYAKAVTLKVGGAIIGTTTTRFPKTATPFTVALLLGTVKYGFSELHP